MPYSQAEWIFGIGSDFGAINATLSTIKYKLIDHNIRGYDKVDIGCKQMIELIQTILIVFLIKSDGF